MVCDGAFSVYMIRCASGQLYTGIAKDVRQRLREHAEGTRGARFLRGKQPLTLVYSAVIGDRSAAARIEYRLKRLPRFQKEALVAGRTTLEVLLPGLCGGRGQASGEGSG